jgi:hypothetical protein
MVLTIQREFPFVGKTKQLHAMEMYIDCMIAYTREHDLPTLKDYLNDRQYDESSSKKRTTRVDH